MKQNKFKIEEEQYTYTYRSYMACEDHGPDDCSAIGLRYNVFRNDKYVKSFSDKDYAKQYIKKWKKRYEKK